jgi:hypothetical protein
MNLVFRHLPTILFSLLALFFLSLYSQYWRLDPVLKGDDILLISPLEELRDLTLWIDLKFQHSFGHPLSLNLLRHR